MTSNVLVPLEHEPAADDPVTPTGRATRWRRWVLANVAGEVVGFGLAAVVGVGVAQLF
jgi:hypothetical protein